MEYSNAEKSIHGRNAQESLEQMLEVFCKKGYIQSYIKDYRIGKPGFENGKQFYAPFMVSFTPENQWILFSTTSMRTDRIKGQQWDTINIKALNDCVKLAILVYSDGISLSEQQEFERQNEKYASGYEYSCIDFIVSQSKLFQMIEAEHTKRLDQGSRKDAEGKSFEDKVAHILSSDQNLRMWKTSDRTVAGIHYPIFAYILNYLHLDPNETKRIVATTDASLIGKLPTGGNPKTDVLVRIEFENYDDRIVTISCKRSSDAKVSVHEYKADAFADVLNRDDAILRRLLSEFQLHPTLSSFGEENVENLSHSLQPYLPQLSQWVLFGIGGLGDSATQWASHIMIYDNNTDEVSFYSADEYLAHLEREKVIGHFGTPFTWTYPSKKRGKSIQLKCRLIK